ncbi:hypothetical protein [Natrinema gelatinilyticum]|uniref:hypothetical protein n=1 Tax=Natrinema gelatinilyticum TaxID=2961571 RepID=UPI0020C28A41|nr:hypothetical protein [Natrinema gelatinilyticum]
MSDAPQQTRYHFFPFVREGYVPTAVDTESGKLKQGTTGFTTTVEGRKTDEDGAKSTTESLTVGKDLTVYGPGEITGINQRQVVRTEPEPGTTDFPPNYFPAVEFDRPDLPWLFTPAKATKAKGKLRPWLCLVTVRKQDGVKLRRGGLSGQGSSSLPVLEIGGPADPATELPDLTEAWMWAHTQLVGNVDLTNKEAIRSEFRSQSNVTLSRLLSPRRLRENEAYRACVVPTYGPGVRAGLGEKPYPDGTKDVELAWDIDDPDAQVRLPVYYHWEFSTGPAGDFEALVRRLSPEQLEGLGIRSVDVGDPGPASLQSTEKETVDLEGALHSVDLSPQSYASEKQTVLQGILDEASALADPAKASEGKTPTLGPPLYGQWHVAAPTIPDEGDQPAWFRDLNVDPRNRLPAGFGTRVVQDKQEQLMAQAWDQVGSLRQANQLLRFAQFGRVAVQSLHVDVVNVPAPSLLQFTANLHSRVNWSDADGTTATLSHRIEGSRLPEAALSPSFRRLARPGGPFARRLATDGSQLDVGELIRGLNDGRLTVGTDDSPGGMTSLDVTVDGQSLVNALCTRARERATAVEAERSDWDLIERGKWDDGALSSLVRTDCQEACAGIQSALTNIYPKDVEPLPPSLDAEPPLERLLNVCQGICGESVNVWGGSLLYDLRIALGSGSLREIASALIALHAEVTKAFDEVTTLREIAEQYRTLVRLLTEILDVHGDVDKQLLTEILDEYNGDERQLLTEILDWYEEIDGELLREIVDICERIETRLLPPIFEECDEFEDRYRIFVVRFVAAVLGAFCIDARTTLASVEREVEETADGEAEARARDRIEWLERTCVAVCGDDANIEEALEGEALLAALSERIDEGDVDGTRRLLRVLKQVLAMARHWIRTLRETFSEQGWDETSLSELTEQCDGFGTFLDLLAARLDDYPSDAIAEQLGPAVCGPAAEEPKPPLDLEAVSQRLGEAIDPETTIRNRVEHRLGGVDLDTRDDPLDQILEAPSFSEPMYEPLKNLSEEYFLPGVEDVPLDSVGLLVTNPAFVEAYMVGLSHEMGRELRWREYPTDLRGTYFRRFWDRRSVVPQPTEAEQNDIAEIHAWDGSKNLGKQSPSSGAGDGETLVLLVRGELLQRYPNTTIYAAKAKQKPGSNPGPNEPIPRVPDLPDPTPGSKATGNTKHPIFRGTLDPDITFLGFDLTPEDAFGTTTQKDDLGWFFVLEEPPGEPRFGLDEPADGDDGTELTDWNDLTWGHLSPNGEYHYVDVGPSKPGSGPPGLAGKQIDGVTWGENSAHMASITWQRPYRMAVHADDMLPPNPNGGP